MIPALIRRGLATALALGVVWPLAPAGADDPPPSVTLDRDEAAPGDRVIVTARGFRAGVITIAVCGNEARRGSPDCNLPQSKGRRTNRDGGPTMAEMPVVAPPVPCPCVIRVTSPRNDEVAVAPITIVGHPSSRRPVDAPAPPTIALAVTVAPRDGGVLAQLRSALGGRRPHVVTVTVRNVSGQPLPKVVLSGSAGRAADEDVLLLDLPGPGSLDPGAVWEHTTSVDVPALRLGSLEWRVTATGWGDTVTASDTTRHHPWLLTLLATVLVVDLAWLVGRHLARRRTDRLTGPVSTARTVTP